MKKERKKEKKEKGLLSIQFILGMSFFVLILVFSIIVLVSYSLKYFHVLHKIEKYEDATEIITRLEYTIYEKNFTLNTSFLTILSQCEAEPYYDPTKGINQYYLKIAKTLTKTKTNNFMIIHNSYLILYANETYNLTSKIGWDENISFLIMRPYNKEVYNTLFINNKSYFSGDTIIWNGKEYVIEYIDKMGNIAIIRENKKHVCGPRVPKDKETIVGILYTQGIKDNEVQKYEVYVW